MMDQYNTNGERVGVVLKPAIVFAPARENSKRVNTVRMSPREYAFLATRTAPYQNIKANDISGHNLVDPGGKYLMRT